MSDIVLIVVFFCMGWWWHYTDVKGTINPLIEQCQKELPRDMKCILVAKPEVK